jgi:hypothetical protein
VASGEADLDRLRGDLEAATRENRPRVLPHPKVIEGFLSQFMALLETDQDRARVLLTGIELDGRQTENLGATPLCKPSR